MFFETEFELEKSPGNGEMQILIEWIRDGPQVLISNACRTMLVLCTGHTFISRLCFPSRCFSAALFSTARLLTHHLALNPVLMLPVSHSSFSNGS